MTEHLRVGTVLTLTCAGCGKQWQWTSKVSRRPKWCSDKCRKRTCYSGVCIDCGGRTDGTASGIQRHVQRCSACSRKQTVKELHAASELYRQEVAALWSDGLTIAEIADVLEVKPNSMAAQIVLLRREGVHLPYRRKESPATRKEQQRRGREAAKRLAELRSAA